MTAPQFLMPCAAPGDSSKLTPCATGDASLITPCHVAQCWTVCSVGFSKNPPAISFACSGCAAPGVVFSRYFTSAADGSDLDIMLPCTANTGTICAASFSVPFRLANRGFGVVYQDVNIYVVAAARSSLVASRFFGCFPDICTQMGLPAMVADPQGARHCGFFPVLFPCPDWCVTAAGINTHPSPTEPGCDISDCVANPSCTPGPL